MSERSAGGGGIEVLEEACAGARLWGLELDTRYRVLAATVELAPEAGPWHLDVDQRIQVLCSPVSTVLGALRRTTGSGEVDGSGGDAGEGAGAGGGLEPVRFEVEQLVDVSATFGGCVLEPPVFGRPEPRPGRWGPVFGLQGRSSAPDGRRYTATFSVADDEARLDLFVRFDDVEIRDADGNELPLTE